MLPKFNFQTLVFLHVLIHASLLSILVSATGKGGVGIEVLDGRYTLHSDSLFNAIILTDTSVGQAAGRFFILEKGRVYKGDREHADPTGVASCLDCNYVYFSSGRNAHWYRMKMSLTFREMIGSQNFSAFNTAKLVPLKYIDERRPFPRMVSITKDGRKGYIAEMGKGVFSFNPRDEMPVLTLLVGKKQISDLDISGCSLTSDEKHLLLTSPTNGFKVEIDDLSKVIKIPLSNACSKEFKVRGMHFRDIVSVSESNGNDLYYAVGHQKGESMAIFMLQRDDLSHEFSCSLVTGAVKASRDHIDSDGEMMRLSRPHQMRLGHDESYLIMTDIDNTGNHHYLMHRILFNCNFCFC